MSALPRFMSWWGGFFCFRIGLQSQGRRAASIKKGIDTELKKITALALSEEERQQLVDKGIALKKPTKLTLLAAALFEKGAKGDLAALKEIFARLEGETTIQNGVVLIDDIKNSP